jgi:hypothetical protein
LVVEASHVRQTLNLGVLSTLKTRADTTPRTSILPL